VVGRIALTADAGQADWYSFKLDRASTVTLKTLDKGASSFVSVLSLYNDDSGDSGDPYNPTGYRLLAQSDGSGQGGDALITQALSPGTYFVAVTGSGNLYFSPTVSGSGYSGSTGPYGLLLTAVPLSIGANDGPAVVYSNPTQAGAVAASPFELRIDFSSAIDPASLVPGQSVLLLYSATASSTRAQIGIGHLNLGLSGLELQITPAAPLVPGFYQMVLAGNTGTHSLVVMGTNHLSLGATVANGHGQDATIKFQVTGNEGIAGSFAADDTLAADHDLGNVTASGLVQVAGAIGTDSADVVPFDPSDVNLYHLQISGPGRFSFETEVFAGRIGSPLDAEASLYELNPDGSLSLVGWNDNTENLTPSDDGWHYPLFQDPGFFAGLTAGQYYLAVYSSGHTNSSPALDLRTSHSYHGGLSTGAYVLNILVQSDNAPPQVESIVATCAGSNGGSYQTALGNDTVLQAAPAQLEVKFSEPINLPQLAQYDFGLTNNNQLKQIFIVGANGATYYPRFYSYNGDSSDSGFLMYEPLPNGTYELHLSGPLGLTDLAGNPLAGNSPSGDYVVQFTVNGPPIGSPSNPTRWIDNSPPGQIVDLGTLFPGQLQQGVTVQRNATSAVDQADWFQFQILQPRQYTITLTGGQLPADVALTLTDLSGNVLPTTVVVLTNDTVIMEKNLMPGTYRFRVSTAQGTLNAGAFLIRFNIPTAMENPPPLTIGAAPAIRFRHVNEGQPASGTTQAAPPVVLVSTTSVPSSSSAPASNSTPIFPEGVLASLGSGPMAANGAAPIDGDVPGSSASQLVFSQTRELFLSEAMVRLPLLVTSAGSGTVENSVSSGALASVMATMVGRLEQLPWKEIAESYHLLPNSSSKLAPAEQKTSASAEQEEGQNGNTQQDEAGTDLSGEAGQESHWQGQGFDFQSSTFKSRPNVEDGKSAIEETAIASGTRGVTAVGLCGAACIALVAQLPKAQKKVRNSMTKVRNQSKTPIRKLFLG
jgi:hypothetical protein